MAYSPTNWTNFPSTATPVNASNLNKIENELVALDTGKADTTALDDKVDKVPGKGLSTEDFTTAEKTKLAGISAQANKVEITPVVTEGTTLATISIDGVDTDIKGSDIDVDNQLKPDSTNPVQNKIIYEALNDLLPEETAEGNPISISDASGLSAKSCEVAFAPVQSGSGDPSPDNIRPISGMDSLRLYQSGSNVIDGLVGLRFVKQEYYGNNVVIDTTNKTALLKMTVSQGYYPIIQMDTRSYPTYFPFKENTQYTFIFKAESTTTTTLLNIGVSYTDGTNNGGFRTSNRDSEGYIVFTTPNDKSVRSLYLGNYSGQTMLYYETICVMEGVHTKAEWEAQNKTTHTTTFSDTVYGGTVDFVSGKLYVTHKIVDLSTLTFTKTGSGYTERFQTEQITDIKLSGSNQIPANAICSSYPNVSWGTMTSQDTNKVISVQGTNTRVAIKNTDYSTAEDFMASLTSADTFCYELATPQEITLTAEQIELLKGNNTLWTDGDNITLKYSADIKDWVLAQLQS